MDAILKETNLLMELLRSRKDLISNYISPSSTLKSKNDVKKEWDSLAQEISSYGFGKPRTGAEIKKKWQDLKCRVRKKALAINKYKSGTGGGPPAPPLSELDRSVIDVLGPAAFSGVPLCSNLDSISLQQQVVPEELSAVEPEFSDIDSSVFINDGKSNQYAAVVPPLASTSQEYNLTEMTPQAEKTPVSIKSSTSRVRKFRRKQRSLKKGSDVQELLDLKRRSLKVKERMARILEVKTRLKCMKMGVNFDEMINEIP
ncbi:nuclear apoptosis-inducing factor 1 [Parasteatoda tepidariorum]|uniref:nuclear apoptosis-inducing factor 1 n=1 Tax=Parasteatoda tepidariorum TaxID=114398 RepID=UPI001C719619|nr:myb/SANT-like DNA-binding domain-containing protein 4 [Parasteatoda tepidariorum]